MGLRTGWERLDGTHERSEARYIEVLVQLLPLLLPVSFKPESFDFIGNSKS
jgi:hypothetical protein